MNHHPKGDRREGDAYYTPDECARSCVAVLPIAKGSAVIEPHCGGGAFVRALLGLGIGLEILANDINPDARALKIPGVEPWSSDFQDFVVPGYEWVVGNPPYEGFEAHVDHALTVAPNVAFLLRLAVMESGARVPCWERWPLRKVWVLAERVPFTSSGSGSSAYGWFWFQRGYAGPSEVVPGWSWKEAKGEQQPLWALT